MAVLMAAWLPIAWLLWSNRTSIRGHSDWLAAVRAVLGVVLLVVTVGMDLGAWWVAAAGILVTAQFVALRSIAIAEPTLTVGQSDRKKSCKN